MTARNGSLDMNGLKVRPGAIVVALLVAFGILAAVGTVWEITPWSILTRITYHEQQPAHAKAFDEIQKAQLDRIEIRTELNRAMQDVDENGDALQEIRRDVAGIRATVNAINRKLDRMPGYGGQE